MSAAYQISFWNLENLFDIQDSPRRSEKLQRAIGGDLEGWTPQVLEKKVGQLASIIRRMNDGLGPDILGVCEVENIHVMNLLVEALATLGRSYQTAHHDMADQRGIDVGFIYDADRFTAEALFSHFVMRRTATRDILQVNFRTSRGRLLVLIGNHWPSRSGGGKLATDGYRAIAGETLAYFHERVQQMHGLDTPVMAMGDFNDEPFDASLTDYALSTRSKVKVINARSARFYNCMWPILSEGLGSLYFDNYPCLLDQFLADKNLLKATSPIRIEEDSVQVLRFPEMTTTGNYPQPLPFGGMGKLVNENGFSDHFPIGITLQEDD